MGLQTLMHALRFPVSRESLPLRNVPTWPTPPTPQLGAPAHVVTATPTLMETVEAALVSRLDADYL